MIDLALLQSIDEAVKPIPAYQFDIAVHNIERPRVLDFGGGSGEIALLLKTIAPDLEITLFDINPDQITKSDELEANEIRWVTDLDPLERYNTVFTWNVTEHLSNPQEEFIRINHLLLPGGVWVGRHHPYYSADGHHMAGRGVATPIGDSPLAGEEFPHIRLPFLFDHLYGRAANAMTLNMMTLFQLRMFAIRAGFRISVWEPSVGNSMEQPLGPDISVEDSRVRSLVFVFEKTANAR